MAELSPAKRQAIASLIDIAPDALLAAIETTFRPAPGPAAAFVRVAARNARVDRAARALVFAPVLALFSPRQDGVRADTFSRASLTAVWAAVISRRPADVEQIRVFIRDGEVGRIALPMLDALCLTAALEVRNGELAAFGLADEAEQQSLSAYFELAPRARPAAELAESWTGGQLDEDRLKQVRSAFSDAANIREDGVPRLMEILFAHLPEGGPVLRLVTAMSGRGAGSFAGESELADFGDRLADYVEAQASGLAGLAKIGDPDDAERAAVGLRRSAAILLQFDLAFIDGGPWGERLAAARGRLGGQLETVFQGVDAKVAKALPMTSQTLAGAMTRKVPDLAADPQSQAVRRARAALILVEGARTFAPLAGCEAARCKASAAAGVRADRYAEGLLDLLQEVGPGQRDNGMALLALSADFLDLTQGADVGALVRRRMATACIARGHEDAA